MSVEQALLRIVEEDLIKDQLPLPSIPKIILEVEQLVNDPEVSLDKIAACIQKDPALTARILRFAHSAWFGSSAQSYSLVQALARVGLVNVRNLVAACAMEPLFTAKNKIVRQRIQQCWQESAILTAACLVLAKYHQGQFSAGSKLDTTQLLLMATTSQVGALPIFHYAEQYESTFANPSLFNRVLPLLTPKLNQAILSLWGFSEQHVDVASQWQQGIDSFAPSYLSMVQLAAILTGLHKVNYEAALLSCYVQSGMLPSLTWWEQAHTQAQFKSLYQAFSGLSTG